MHLESETTHTHIWNANCFWSSQQIPKEDPRFGRNSEECMPFFRSAAGCGSGNTGHIFGASNVRQQMNSLTAFIDVGQVYGADDVKARSLRDLSSDKGLLKVNTEHTDNGRELLPFFNMDANMCATRAHITNDSNAEEVPCFLAGEWQQKSLNTESLKVLNSFQVSHKADSTFFLN